MSAEKEKIKALLLERIFSEQSGITGLDRKYLNTQKPTYTSTDKWPVKKPFASCESIVFYDTNSWWPVKYEKHMTINHDGLKIKGKIYKWENILTTHIKEESSIDDTVHYLTLGLDDEWLYDFDLYPYSLSKKFLFARELTPDILCAAIEYFKPKHQQV